MVLLMRSGSLPSTGALAFNAVSRYGVNVPRLQKAGIHDLIIKRKTGQAIVKAGPYGGGR